MATKSNPKIKVVTSQSSKLSSHLWDPLQNDDTVPTKACVMRIQNDLRAILSDPIPGILVVPDDDDISLNHALIVGPEGTPYEGGFFYFLLRFPHNYPLSPPRVRIMTTGNGRVRFNPNLYANGKVCLSILGTWSGPPWSPAQTLSSVLISIQSLMNEKPYFNEPGFSFEKFSGESKLYNTYLMHETIRVAVCDNIDGSRVNARDQRLPRKLRIAMMSFFTDYFDHYVSICEREVSHDGTSLYDPFHHIDSSIKFRFGHLKQRLHAIKETIDDELGKLTAEDQVVNFPKACQPQNDKDLNVPPDLIDIDDSGDNDDDGENHDVLYDEN